MRRLGVAVLLLIPLFILHAGGLAALKSDITVEPGVYKNGWERDFFRDLPTDDPTEDSTDNVPAAPDADAATAHQRRTVAITREREIPPPSLAIIPAPEKEGLDNAPPPTVAERRPPDRSSEPVIVPERPRATDAPQTIAPPADPEKKRKERLREMESKRKKGSFRDPKLTY